MQFRKSRNTWSNWHIWPWSTEWSGAKANRVLPRKCTGHSNTLFQQHKRRLYTWTSPDGQHWNQIDYILCSQRWRSSIQSAKTSLGADCGSDHELLIAKFRLKLKKVGKTTRPFRYDLNQIPYDYTARQASLSITNSQSLLELMSIESVMPSNRLILCRPFLLLLSIFPSIRVFSSQSVLHIRWPKYWEFQLQHQSFQWIFRTNFL